MNIFRTIDFSIIIPCFNAADCIEACLSALKSQTIQRDRYEIIVIDDGSTDETASKAGVLCDRVIRIPNSGPAAARNRGVREATGEIVLFTDSDCIPHTDWIEKMIQPFTDMAIFGVKGAYRTSQRSFVARFVQAEYEFKYRRMEQLESIDFVDTYAAAFRRSIFLQLGGFNEKFPGASVEDQEFSFRMAEAGFKMVFIPDALVDHRHADTLGWYFRKKKNIGFWKVVVLRRHPRKIVSDSHTPQSLKLQLPLAGVTIITAISTPFVGAFPLIASVFLFMFAGFSEILHCYHRCGIVSAAGAPIIMWIRSVGLGFGLVTGFLNASKLR
ncbi:glycosyltransferase [bacterium]|nr:glycosyltransferase [candidate division CSSED10-310 bacterium]